MDQKKRERLFGSIHDSYRRVRPYREQVVRLIEEYAGPFYVLDNAHSARLEKYLPLLKQAAGAYMTLLASNNPRVLVSTHKREHMAFANHFGTALNKLIEEIELQKTLAQWVLDAFFWLGIIKVHMADTGQQKQEGDLLMDPGKPFASNVALDNFFWDTNARKWSECQYMGDVYRVTVDSLMDDSIYSLNKELRQFVADTDHDGHGTEDEQKDLSRGYEPTAQDLEPMARVADVWIPREGIIETYIVETKSHELKLRGEPIATMEWDGVELGPYNHLHFDEVPENILPSSIAADLYPLDRLVNNIYRKNARKAKRQKDINVYEPSASDTARKLQHSSDGDWVGVTNPRDVTTVRQGGMDANLHGFMLNGMELFDRMAGNLQAMLGLGAQSSTVGQEKLIHGAASRREGHMQDRMYGATRKLIKSVAFLLWQDDFTEIPARTEVPGLPGISYDDTWMPKDREGEFNDYMLDIDIYSMQYQGPGSRIQAINELLQTVYIPLMPAIQQQGGMIDLAKLAEMHADMLNLPRLRDVVVFNVPPVVPEGGGLDQPRKSPVTNRTYTRRNESGKNTGVPSSGDWIGKEQS